MLPWQLRFFRQNVFFPPKFLLVVWRRVYINYERDKCFSFEICFDIVYLRLKFRLKGFSNQEKSLRKLFLSYEKLTLSVKFQLGVYGPGHYLRETVPVSTVRVLQNSLLPALAVKWENTHET